MGGRTLQERFCKESSSFAQDGRPYDLADLFYANVKKTVEGAVAKNRIVEARIAVGALRCVLQLLRSLCAPVPEVVSARVRFTSKHVRPLIYYVCWG